MNLGTFLTSLLTVSFVGNATYIAKRGICYKNSRLSVRPSVCRTREQRINGSRYRNRLHAVW